MKWGSNFANVTYVLFVLTSSIEGQPMTLPLLVVVRSEFVASEPTVYLVHGWSGLFESKWDDMAVIKFLANHVRHIRELGENSSLDILVYHLDIHKRIVACYRRVWTMYGSKRTARIRVLPVEHRLMSYTSNKYQ